MTNDDKALVERLRDEIIADAFEEARLLDGRLAERLIRERLSAADRIEALSAKNDIKTEAITALLLKIEELECFESDAVAENKRLRETLELADEYIRNLESHDGCEGFSASTYELSRKYEGLRAALKGQAND